MTTVATMKVKNLDTMTPAEAETMMGLAVGRVVRIMGGEVSATSAEIDELRYAQGWSPQPPSQLAEDARRATLIEEAEAALEAEHGPDWPRTIREFRMVAATRCCRHA